MQGSEREEPMKIDFRVADDKIPEFIKLRLVNGLDILLRTSMIGEIFRHPKMVGVTSINRLDQLSYDVKAPSYDVLEMVFLKGIVPILDTSNPVLSIN